MATVAPATPSTSTERDWTKPQAMAIPKEGYFEDLRKGGTAQSFPRLQPATALPSSRRSNLEERTRSVHYGKTIEKAIADRSRRPRHA